MVEELAAKFPQYEIVELLAAAGWGGLTREGLDAWRLRSWGRPTPIRPPHCEARAQLRTLASTTWPVDGLFSW